MALFNSSMFGAGGLLPFGDRFGMPEWYGQNAQPPAWSQPPAQAAAAIDMPTGSYAMGGGNQPVQNVPMFGQAQQPPLQPTVQQQMPEISSQQRISQPAPAPQPAQPAVNAWQGLMGVLSPEVGDRNVTIKALMSKGLDRDMASAAARNPQLMQAILPDVFNRNNFKFTVLPDGTMVRENPRDGTVSPVYQAGQKPSFGVIGKDADGKEKYGFIDTGKQAVKPIEPFAAPDNFVTGPDGKQIPIPAGVDRKAFVGEISRANAKVQAGERTEVQAKSEKFANKMEFAQKNLSGIDDTGTSQWGRSMESLYGGVGNYAQSAQYQKYKQARDSFITALLRDESGAAIGTEEFKRYERELFPLPADGPEVIKQKAELRQVAIEAMKKAAGPGYKSPVVPEAPNLGDRLKEKYGLK